MNSRRTSIRARPDNGFRRLFLIVLIRMAAAVIDVGAWMRADRKLQSAADAAALAARRSSRQHAWPPGGRRVRQQERRGHHGANVTFPRT